MKALVHRNQLIVQHLGNNKPVILRWQDVDVTSLGRRALGVRVLLGHVLGAWPREASMLGGLTGAPRKLMEPVGLSQPPTRSEGWPPSPFPVCQ